MTFVQTEEGGRFDVGYNAMHYFKRERERGQKHSDGWRTGFLKAVNFGFVRLCRWMHFWNGGHLRSAPASRQGTKKRREKREKEYVSGSSSSSTYTRARKKGVTRCQHIGKIYDGTDVLWKCMNAAMLQRCPMLQFFNLIHNFCTTERTHVPTRTCYLMRIF